MLQDRIKPFGIPIRKEFIDQFDKNSIKKELGLDARPVVLVMGGGFGLGAVQETVQTILNTDSNLQILAITGKNLHLQTQLAKVAETDSNLHVYGYIDNISQFMSASDLIVTKPGGVTIAEVLAKKLPMIIIDPLPGQEDGNTEFLLNWGVAVKPGQFSTLPSLINHLFGNNLRMKQMREMAEFLSKPYAADDITNLVIDILVN